MNFEEYIVAFAHVYGKLEGDLILKTKPDVLTPLQYRLLLIFSPTTKKTPGEISDCLNLTLPNTSRELRHLKALGLIKKEVDATDKRCVWISTTDAGNALLDLAKGEMAKIFSKAFSHVSPEELEKVLHAFSYLTKVLDITLK